MRLQKANVKLLHTDIAFGSNGQHSGQVLGLGAPFLEFDLGMMIHRMRIGQNPPVPNHKPTTVWSCTAYSSATVVISSTQCGSRTPSPPRPWTGQLSLNNSNVGGSQLTDKSFLRSLVSSACLEAVKLGSRNMEGWEWALTVEVCLRLRRLIIVAAELVGFVFWDF